MELSPTIDGGLKTIGGGSNGFNYYYSSPRTSLKQEKFSLLRVGEIVYGRISSLISSELANVKLPIGTFTAFIHKQIKQGDELYLKVEEVSPSLILKVHSVSSTINNIPLTSKEIIRILDLPNDEIYVDVVEFIKDKKNIILRNDILLFVKSFNFISKKIDDSYIKTDVLKTIYLMREGDVEPEFEIFNSLYIGFNGERRIQELLNKFVFYSNLLPLNSKNRILSYINLNEGNTINIKKSINFFSHNGNYEESFYQILHKILQINSINKHFQELQTITKKIIEIVDSNNFWNLLALSSCTTFRILLPINSNDDIKVATLSIECNKSLKTALLNNNKSIENAINFDFVGYLCNRIKPQNLKLSNNSDYSELAELIESLLNPLGFNLRSFVMYDENGSELEITKNRTEHNRIKLSIVV